VLRKAEIEFLSKGSVFLLALILGVAYPDFPVRAEEPAPFELDPNQWQPSGIKDNVPGTAPIVSAPVVVSTPIPPVAPPTPTPPPAVVLPTPTMPGMSKIFDVPMNSTEDIEPIDPNQWQSSNHTKDDVQNSPPDSPQDNASVAAPADAVSDPASYPAAILPTPAMPGLNKSLGEPAPLAEKNHSNEKTSALTPETTAGLPLPKENWKAIPPKDGATHASKNDDDYSDDDHQVPQSLNVRMSFLPAQNVTPIPGPSHESAQKLGHDLMRKSLEKKPAQTAKDASTAASCAALDAYKRQQLDALQGDRETLKALQDAVHSLGLSKQLDLTAKAGGSVLSTTSFKPPANANAAMAKDVR